VLSCKKRGDEAPSMTQIDPTLVKGLLCSVFYVSISITLFNKMVLSGYKFQYPNVMTLCQQKKKKKMLFTMRALGLAQFPGFDYQTAQQVLPLTLSFLGMVLTGLTSLGHLTVPMFDALRRSTTLITLLGQWYFLGQKKFSRSTMVHLPHGGRCCCGRVV